MSQTLTCPRLGQSRVPREAKRNGELASLLLSLSLLLVIGSGCTGQRPTYGARAQSAKRTVTTRAAPTTTTLPSLAAPHPDHGIAIGPDVPVLSRLPINDNVVFLTMDDGLVQDPAATKLLLQAKVPVTLFLVRSTITGGADYFRQWVRGGALIEDHTLNHPDMSRLNEAQQRAEICGNADLTERTFGRRPVLFRPPYGNWNQATRTAAGKCGIRAILLWHAAVNDGRVQFQGPNHLQPGDIILMHFRTNTVGDMQAVLTQARADGMRLGRIEDYLVPDSIPAGTPLP